MGSNTTTSMDSIPLLFLLVQVSFGSPLNNIPTIDVTSPDVEVFRQAIQDVGAVAFTGLGQVYQSAISSLHKEASTCSHEDFFSMKLEASDAQRLTIGVDSTDSTENFPGCVKEITNAIGKSFDEVEQMVVNMLHGFAKETHYALSVNVDGSRIDL